MVANFVPTYANLAMGLWEQYIWTNNPYGAHIIFYGHYIDYIKIIWDGLPSSIDSFVSHYNHKYMGLTFTFVHNAETLAFLDLGLWVPPSMPATL